MRSHSLVISLLLLVQALAACAQGNPGTGGPPVAVLVSATDNGGHPVAGLTKDHIGVLDNNSRATVADFRPVGDAPLSVGIVLLASRADFAKQQAAAIELIQKLIRSPQDRAFVVTAGGVKRAQGNIEWRSDRDALIKDVNALDAGAGVPDAFNYELSTQNLQTATSGGKVFIETRQANEGATIFDVAWNMMMADKRPARRALVLFRSCWAHSPGVSKPTRDYVDQKHAQIVQTAQQLHVAVFSFGIEETAPGQFGGMTDIGSGGYGVNMMGGATREMDRQEALGREGLYNGGRANIERMTALTGGRAWWSSKYSDDVNNVVNALSGQYLLMFVPAKDSPGAHELKINCKKAKVAAPGAFLVMSGSAAK